MGEWKMKVLVAGADGFIGKNLVAGLRQLSDVTVLPFEKGMEPGLLDRYCAECGFVFNLAGVNRPEDTREFMEGNCGFAAQLLEKLQLHKNSCPVMYASSVQAAWDNPYGRSKKAGEDAVFAYGRKTGAQVLVYRFPNVFGKWCRPGYNSAIATFSYNIARGLPIQVHDEGTVMRLAYIDDVVAELLRAMEGHPHKEGDGYCSVPVVHEVTLGEAVAMLRRFKESRQSLLLPDMTEEGFEKKLYSTYLSFLPEDGFSYPLLTREDERGSFTEILKSQDRGQVSVNVTKPGIGKGNHWHHTKNEKFIVVSGSGIIRFRKYGSDEVITYHVSGEKLEAVDIPPGYVHAIENVGDTDLVTLMWCNECFQPERPDTIPELVSLK